MVCKDGTVKLMDFGIATPTTASIHTMEGTVVGTLQYLSPEQLEGKEIDVRVDVYALGTVIYEMLTGVRAFPETNLARLVPDKLNNRYVPLHYFKTRIPRVLRELVLRCMRYEKENRVGSAIEFLKAWGKIHKRLTDLSPEQVMRRYMQQPQEKKAAIVIRSKKLLFPVILWVATVITFISAVSVGTWYFFTEKKPHIYTRIYEGAKVINKKVLMKRSDVPERIGTTDIDNAAGTDAGVSGEPERAGTRPAVPNTVRDKARKDAGDEIRRKEARQEDGNSSSPPAERNKDFFRESAQQEKPAPTLFSRLSAKYKTDNVLTMVVSEVGVGNYSNALDIFSEINPTDAETIKAKVYRMRALAGAGQKAELKSFVVSNKAADGELFLEKAMQYYHAKDYNSCNSFLAQASSMPAQFMDQQIFRARLLHARGLCASALFDANPTVATKKEAMGAWFDVKTFLRTSTDHEFFKTADEEIRRINKATVTL
jgi:hypothetical protein